MENERGSCWIETCTGIPFYPLDPRPEEISINDIAHALSLICRYNGHARYHYSVAQHSIYCSYLAMLRGHGPLVAMYALLHDAAEAYICDIPRPIKGELTGYAQIEHDLQWKIFEAFGLTPLASSERKDIAHLVKTIDDDILNIEAVTLLSKASWARPVDNAIRIEVTLWPWQWAEIKFKEEYSYFSKQIGIKEQEFE